MHCKHVLRHVLVKHAPVRHVPVRHMLGHALKPVLGPILKHVPNRHMLEHVPQNRQPDP